MVDPCLGLISGCFYLPCLGLWSTVAVVAVDLDTGGMGLHIRSVVGLVPKWFTLACELFEQLGVENCRILVCNL